MGFSSAITTARGVPTNGTDPEQIDRVVRAYLAVGEALQERTPIPYAGAARKHAEGITGVLRSSKVEAIRFETAERDAIVRETTKPETPAQEEAYGAVTGRIQTLTSRNSLRFTIYDHINDRAVSCYLVKGREAMMRQMWDRVATVEGWVSRDPRQAVRGPCAGSPTWRAALTEVGLDYKQALGSALFRSERVAGDTDETVARCLKALRASTGTRT